ncbi:MAG: prohibitin family protein [Verrucomicrobia bacterium]|nr:prohibitin family protein [Cytophagales bacterium]
MKNHHIGIALAILSLSSCTIIRQGEIGVKRTLGKISPLALPEGPRTYNPLVATVIKMSTRTENIEVKLNLPSKEGLTITSEISILYRIKPAMAPVIFQNIGLGYADEIIVPVFRSAAADISSKFYAKDLHSGERALIEKNIRDQMASILEPKGFIVENVLLKSIQLPAGLARSVEEKLQAEQEAQRMEFVKEKERRDAERRIIQAEGEKNSQIIAAEAQKRRTEIEAEGKANAIRFEAEAQARANEMLNKSITPVILRYRAIDAFKSLSGSSNTKIVITDGKNPFLGLSPQLFD